MLETDQFPAEYLPKFTSQVNNWLGDMIRDGQIPEAKEKTGKAKKAAGSAAQPKADSYQLGENFLMMFLNDPELHAVSSLDRDVSELVMPTGRRHYQINRNGRAIAYARSLIKGNGSIEENESLCQLFPTTLAKKVQKAIRGLDAYERKHAQFAAKRWRVRLVTIPTFHTHAFLLQRIQNGDEEVTSGSFLWVVSTRPWLEKLTEGKMLSSRRFLLGFKDKAPILGVPQTPPQQSKEQTNMAKKKGETTSSPASRNQKTSSASDLGRPIFASLIYPITNDSSGTGISGGGGHIGTIGGPPEGVEPIFVMFTYPVPPKPMKQNITEEGKQLP